MKYDTGTNSMSMPTTGLNTKRRLGHVGTQNQSPDPATLGNFTYGSCIQTAKSLMQIPYTSGECGALPRAVLYKQM